MCGHRATAHHDSCQSLIRHSIRRLTEFSVAKTKKKKAAQPPFCLDNSELWLFEDSGRRRLLWILINLMHPASCARLLCSTNRLREIQSRPPVPYSCPRRHTLEPFQVNRGVVCRQTDIAP